ncbi:MAG: hypothetical protein J1E57_00905 [Prevotella sp.]|nr:hypothetical protein [Prevotella sp.]
MEPNKEESIKEVRNVAKCFAKGTAMYLRSFMSIIRKSWHVALLHAVAFSALLIIFANYYLPLNNYHNVGMPTDEKSLFTSALAILALIVIGGILEFCVYLCLLRIFVPQDKPLHTFARGIKLCFHHLGTTFGALFISLMVVAVALCVFMLPAVVLLLANINAQIGILNGDPVGTTSSMVWLTNIVYPISGLLKLFITSLPLFVLYYACGSMAAKDEAKNKFKKDTPI